MERVVFAAFATCVISANIPEEKTVAIISGRIIFLMAKLNLLQILKDNLARILSSTSLNLKSCYCFFVAS